MELHKFIVDQNNTVKQAMEKMDENGKEIVYVVNDNKLIGSLSDGDVRRYILKDGDISLPVEQAMHTEPVSIFEIEYSKTQEIFESNTGINSIPELNDDSTIRTILFRSTEQIYKEKLTAPVVIMAGGKGTRLYPYTKILPKPLIPIGDTPIVERIINRFNKFGSDKILMSVNYKKNMIKSYFNDIDSPYRIDYFEEDKPLGTGGSLSLMREQLKETFFVSNCDILIDADYTSIYDFHKKNEYDVTMVASVKNTVIPYGVLKLDKEGLLDSTEEKPEYTHLINTGMYLLEPSIVDLVPDDKFTDLPTVITKAKNKGLRVGVYPVSENSWLDMGQIKEMENMIDSLGV